MKKQIKKFKILGIETLKNSYFGNPKYLLILQDENGNVKTGKTQTNASIGYEICTNWINSYKTLQHHYTKNNNLIITYNIK